MERLSNWLRVTELTKDREDLKVQSLLSSMPKRWVLHAYVSNAGIPNERELREEQRCDIVIYK